MAKYSGISWTDHTFNPWIGCNKVSPGCDRCYAEALMDKRYHKVTWGPGQSRRRTGASNWRQPLNWNKAHERFYAEHGRRQRVFCASLADVFDNEVDPQWRVDLFKLIDQTPNLDWLLLTKRIGNAQRMLDEVSVALALRESGAPWPPRPNVWLGATVVNQEEADRDIPKLLATPARVRFLSMEPLLGPVRLDKLTRKSQFDDWEYYDNCLTGFKAHKNGGWFESHVDWVIVGGESGPGARPMHPDWARSLRDQCSAAGVPFHFKQWGEYSIHEVGHDGAIVPPMPMHIKGLRVWTDALGYVTPAGTAMVDEVFAPGSVLAVPCGKEAAGYLLDDVEHNGFPASQLRELATQGE
jgi:protein gp37